MEWNSVSENHRDDIDLATAAEQSSEDDEAQEGNSLAADEDSVDAAEQGALHVEDENEEAEAGDLAGLIEALDAAIDPEADAIVDEAIDINTLDEADASVAAVEDEADIEAEEAANEELDVPAYDGPELDDNGDPIEVDPYDEFRKELKAQPGKWFVIHSYAGFEKRVKQNIENRKISTTSSIGTSTWKIESSTVIEILRFSMFCFTRFSKPA